MGHCKVKCSLCTVQQVWCSLHWMLQPGWAGGLWGVLFYQMLEYCRCAGAARYPHRTEPCQCVRGQTRACNGPLQGQMQPLQCAAGVVEPVLSAAAGLGRWFVGCTVMPNAGVLQVCSCCSATTTHRALPVRDLPALDIPWATARSNAPSAVRSRCGRACTKCCSQHHDAIDAPQRYSEIDDNNQSKSFVWIEEEDVFFFCFFRNCVPSVF